MTVKLQYIDKKGIKSSIVCTGKDSFLVSEQYSQRKRNRRQTMDYQDAQGKMSYRDVFRKLGCPMTVKTFCPTCLYSEKGECVYYRTAPVQESKENEQGMYHS